MPSSNISRLFSIATPMPANSCGWYARPMPKFRRPRERQSISAKSEAVRNGWLNGTTTTAVPMRMRRSRCAAAAQSTCVDVTMPYVEKRCSATHAVS